jgi:TP53 regulating kinase-like protein
MQKIYQGAEAIISRDGDVVVKERIRKGYRIAEIDERLRSRRTRLESRLISEARRAGVPTPRVLEESKFAIMMEFIDGDKVKDALDEKNFGEIAMLIGKTVAILHNYNIIHGDLTTSNMIVKAREKPDAAVQYQDIYFVDFGLGFTSTRMEDKAIDLHVLQEALESAHFQIYERMWKLVLAAYGKHYEKAGEVIKTLSKIEKRGRYAERSK